MRGSYRERASRMRPHLDLSGFGLLLVLQLLAALPSVAADAVATTDLLAQQTRLTEAINANVRLLAPRRFADATEAHEEAVTAATRGRTDRIARALAEGDEALRAATAHADAVRAVMQPLLDIRARAVAADAAQYAPRVWKDAEAAFQSTISRAESRGGADPLEANHQRAQALYDEAELAAIKTSLLGTFDALLQRAEKENIAEFAPVTLADAKALRIRAQQQLHTDRTDRAAATQLIERGVKQVQHATTLARVIDGVQEGPEGNLEVLILRWESKVAEVARALAIEPAFELGFEQPLDALRQRMLTLASQGERAARERDDLARKLEDVTGSFARSERELASARQELVARTAAMQAAAPTTSLVQSTPPSATPANASLPREPALGAAPATTATTTAAKPLASTSPAPASGQAATTQLGAALATSATNPSSTAPRDAPTNAAQPSAAIAAQTVFAPNEAIVAQRGEEIVVSLIGLDFGDDPRQPAEASMPLLRKLRGWLASSLPSQSSAVLRIYSYYSVRAREQAIADTSEANAEGLKNYLVANVGLPAERIKVHPGQPCCIDPNASATRAIDLVVREPAQR